MFRFILEFVGFLLFFAAVRTILSWIMRLFAQTVQTQGQQQSARTRQGGVLHSAGELRKDPVCGTFVPMQSSLKRTVNGETLYFCSVECRDRYPARA